MANNLVIIPFNTELDVTSLNHLGEVVVPSFRGAYDKFHVLNTEFTEHRPGSNIFAKDIVLQTYTVLNAIPFEGIHRYASCKLGDNEHGLIVTDMILSYGGYWAGGTADNLHGTGLVTTRDMPNSNQEDKDSLISRLAGVSVHELGHLYGLEHHDTKVSDEKYCPMITSSPSDFAHKDEKSWARFLDSRASTFCEPCYKKIK